MKIDSLASSEDRETQALLEILSWSRDLSDWQRDALRRLCTTEELSDQDFDELESICLGKSDSHSPLTRDDLPNTGSLDKTVNVLSIRDVVNVDLLDTSKPLSFCETGMTVVYGPNGTGKSGYTKVLKRVCRSRSPKRVVEIVENVYTENSVNSSAVVEFTVNGQRANCDWVEGSPTDSRLSAVSVFDSETAGVHVDGENAVAYTPLPMRILEKLADACVELKGRIDSKLSLLNKQSPSGIYTHEFEGDNAVSKLMKSLNGDTEVTHVKQLANMNETERAKLVELQRDLIDVAPEKTASRLETQSSVLGEINTRISVVLRVLSDESVSHLIALYRTYTTSKQVAKLAAEKAFSDSALTSVSSEAWQMLWEAARAYSQKERYPGQNFPFTETGARCVLCHQELDKEAVTRLNQFEDFVQDSTKGAEIEAKSNYEEALVTIEQSKEILEDATTKLELLDPEIKDEKVYQDCQEALIQIGYRLVSVIENHQKYMDIGGITPCPTWPESAIRELTQHLSDRISGLRSNAQSEAHQSLVAELGELKDREWLNGIQADVIREIDRINQRSKLERASRDTKTNRITAMNKQLVSTLITENLRTKFVSEIENLKLMRLKVELQESKGEKGVPHFQLRLRNSPKKARIGLVLSEGEHSCVALAAFLAELETSGRNSAIVLDDPVSSLDEAFRNVVADRLVEESTVRQVIVFTHDLAFLFLLDEICRNKDVQLSVKAVDRTEEQTGIVQRDLPVRAQPVTKLIEGIQNKLNNEKGHYTSGRRTNWEATVEVLSRRLRIAWERVVEETVGPVFKRLSRKVETRGLAKLTVLEISDCEEMREAYGRCSSLLHSDPTVLQPIEPTPDLVQHEIDVLKNWYEEIRKRQSKVDE